MKQMTVRAAIMLAVAGLFVAGIAIFVVIYTVDADDWALYPANRHIYTVGQITQAGQITDRNGTVLAQTQNGQRVYNEDQQIREATLHAVGDLDGFISTGLHASYLKELTGYNLVNGVYSYSGNGNNIQTTLDADVCAAALDALDGKNGTVGVYNYKTGEVICMVSTPTYDVEDEQASEAAKNGDYKGVFVNRFLSGDYTPGSTFKIVTTAASLDTFSDAYDREYTCNGGVMIDGEWISCMGDHGTIRLEEALAKSCNAYFSQLAVDLGEEVMTEYAEKFGFNQSFSMDGIAAKTSYFNVEDTRDIDLAWAGMGQYTNMMNPLQYLTAIGAIANGGVPVEPYMVDKITTNGGLTVKNGKGSNGSRMLSAETAEKLTELMANNVEVNYGTWNYPGLDLCAKSGTAEVGEGRTPNAVFVGFLRNEDLPLAFVVVVEGGGAGSSVGGRVANQVLQAAKDKLT